MIEVRTFIGVSLPCGRNRFAEEDIRNMFLDKHGDVDFGILLPMPKEVAEDNDGNFHFDFMPTVGPEWRYENWGCDWNGENARFDDMAENFTFTIDTTYKPPIGWLKALCSEISERFSGAYLKGVWVPNKFGDTTFGEFTCENGAFSTTTAIGWDEPLMVKNLWELDDEDLIAFRGFVNDESATKEHSDEEPPTEIVEEAHGEEGREPLPWIIGETPIEEIKEKVKWFVREWTRNW